VKLNSISIGGGLALVAVGLLANAAASLVGSPDRTANADDLKRAAKSPQPVADVAVSRADEGGAEMVAMGDSGGCIWGEPLEWFGDIHELPDCAIDTSSGVLGFALQGSNAANASLVDVNKDGFLDAVRTRSHGGNAPIEWLLFPAKYECGVWIEDWKVVGGSMVLLRRCVLSRERLVAFAQKQSSFALASLYMRDGGWRDMDKDGDLDFAFILLALGVADGWQKAFWIENTGYEATQPLVGDLDGDGSVGASDLTMLLGGWTGN
jgi:hypothetical protein